MSLADKTCSTLIEGMLVPSLGSGDPAEIECVWRSADSFQIFLGVRAAISPGDILTTRAGIIQTADGISDMSPSMSATVLVPENAIEPVLVVTGPDEIDQVSHNPCICLFRRWGSDCTAMNS